MTLSQQNRQRLAGYLCDHRPDWHLAGTTDAITRLDVQHPNDPLLVAAKAVAAARNPASRGPAAMLGVEDKPAVTPRPTPRATDPDCPECGSQLTDPDGRCVGCKQNAATAGPARPVVASLRPASPPPADFRDRVAAARVGNNLEEGNGNG